MNPCICNSQFLIHFFFRGVPHTLECMRLYLLIMSYVYISIVYIGSEKFTCVSPASILCKGMHRCQDN